VGRGLAALFEVGVTALSPPETDRLLLRDQGSGTVCQMTLQLLHLSTKTENALVSAVISGYYFVGLVC